MTNGLAPVPSLQPQGTGARLLVLNIFCVLKSILF